jgi:hypothetical protein
MIKVAGSTRADRRRLVPPRQRGEVMQQTLAEVEAVIWRTSAAGIPGGQARLF